MKHIKYFGKRCRRNHTDELGRSERYIKTNSCVQCCKEASRERGGGYKDYQANYHALLRKEHPEKLEQYWQTQFERGNHTWQKIAAKNKKANSNPATEQPYELLQSPKWKEPRK